MVTTSVGGTEFKTMPTPGEVEKHSKLNFNITQELKAERHYLIKVV